MRFCLGASLCFLLALACGGCEQYDWDNPYDPNYGEMARMELPRLQWCRVAEDSSCDETRPLDPGPWHVGFTPDCGYIRSYVQFDICRALRPEAVVDSVVSATLTLVMGNGVDSPLRIKLLETGRLPKNWAETAVHDDAPTLAVVPRTDNLSTFEIELSTAPFQYDPYGGCKASGFIFISGLEGTSHPDSVNVVHKIDDLRFVIEYVKYSGESSLEVESPTSSDTWIEGYEYPVSWTSRGTVGAQVRIELHKGEAFDSIIAASTSNDGSFYWTVPEGVAQGSDYRIKVISLLDERIYDYSAAFTIHERPSFKIYVANQGDNTVSAIDGESQTVLATIPVGDHPNCVTASTNGRVYVSHTTNCDSIAVIDAWTDRVIEWIVVGGQTWDIAVSKDNSRAYAALHADGKIAVIDLRTSLVTDWVLTPDHSPNFICLSPDDQSVYVSLRDPSYPVSSDNRVGVIETSTLEIEKVLVRSGHSIWPTDLVASAFSGLIYVGYGGDYGASISVRRRDNLGELDEIDIERRWPTEVAISDDGSRIYTANYYGSSVSVVDAENNSLLDNIQVSYKPWGIAVSPDGQRVFVSIEGGYNSGNTIEVIDTSTLSVAGEIEVGKGPFGVCVISFRP